MSKVSTKCGSPPLNTGQPRRVKVAVLGLPCGPEIGVPSGAFEVV